MQQEGTIARLVQEKHFGFIKIQGEQKDIFFHANELRNVRFEELKEGDTLSFEVASGEKGPNAINITKI